MSYHHMPYYGKIQNTKNSGSSPE